MDQKSLNYFRLKKVNNSGLGHFGQSPLHYQHSLGEDHKTTPAKEFGRMFHSLILEPHTLRENYISMDFGKRTEPEKGMGSKLNMAWKAAILKEAEETGRAVVTREDYETAKRMQEAMFSNPLIRELFAAPGRTEEVIEWVDETHGVECKGRLDRPWDSNEAVVDLKTIISAEEARFEREAYRYGWHRQAAFYLDGSGAKTYYIVAIEKDEPYASNVFRAGKNFLAHGRMEYKGALAQIVKCRAKYGSEWGETKWPGYQWWNPAGCEIDVPAYAKERY